MTAKLLASTATLAALMALSSSAAQAQSVFPSYSAPIDANPTKGRAPASAKGNAENGVMTIGDVLFSGSLIAGGVYNDNLYSTRFRKVSDVGLYVAPSFNLRRDDGLHSTSVSGYANSQFYANNSNANVTTGALSATHLYEVQRDLIVYLQGSVSRNLNATSQAYGSGFKVSPITYTQEFAAGSIEKSFDRISVGLGGYFLAQQHENVQTATGFNLPRQGLNGNSQTIVGRIGYAVTPLLQAFIQPTYNWQSFDNPLNDSQGYTVTAGLRTDRIGLFRGEIFGGYRHQTFDNLNQRSSGPTFGGNVSWYPTRDLTFTARVAQSYGLTEGEAFQGGTGVTTSASLSASYVFSNVITTGAYISYSQQDSNNLRGKQNLYTAGTSLNYMFTNHLGVNLGYSFTKVSYANGPGGYQRNLVTIGTSARF